MKGNRVRVMVSICLMMVSWLSMAHAQSIAETDGGDLSGCLSQDQSNLAGVTLHITSERCQFSLEEAAAGLTFAYALVVSEPLDSILVEPHDSGRCSRPDESGLIIDWSITGGDQAFDISDSGLCVPFEAIPHSLTPGTYTGSFEWTGRNWHGPSDTMNPLGPAFPPGQYEVTFVATGVQVTEGGNAPFEVRSTLTIQLTP